MLAARKVPNVCYERFIDILTAYSLYQEPIFYAMGPADGVAVDDLGRFRTSPGFDAPEKDRPLWAHAHLTVNGCDVGGVLIGEGLARPYNGGRRQVSRLKKCAHRGASCLS